jgi:hypothetical protein
MSHTLTRRTISAIAKLDFSSLSHTQRLDAIAKTLGFDTAAALMGTLKSDEMDASPKTQTDPIIGIFAFGSTMCRVLAENESLIDEDGTVVDGEIKEVTFATVGELDAYTQGVQDADGWGDSGIFETSISSPNITFFAEKKLNPNLTYAQWYQTGIEQQPLDEKFYDDIVVAENYDAMLTIKMPERATQPIAGYQVTNRYTREHWGDKPSFEILTFEDALQDLNASRKINSQYELTLIRENDIEDPTHS